MSPLLSQSVSPWRKASSIHEDSPQHCRLKNLGILIRCRGLASYRGFPTQTFVVCVRKEGSNNSMSSCTDQPFSECCIAGVVNLPPVCGPVPVPGLAGTAPWIRISTPPCTHVRWACCACGGYVAPVGVHVTLVCMRVSVTRPPQA